MFYSKASKDLIRKGFEIMYWGGVTECYPITTPEDICKVYGEVESDDSNTTCVVMIDLEDPSASLCSCGKAEGEDKLCEHKIALFFETYPDVAERYEAETTTENAPQDNDAPETDRSVSLEQRFFATTAKLTSDELRFLIKSLLLEFEEETLLEIIEELENS